MSKHSSAVVHDGQPHYEDINTPLILMLTLITAVVTYAIIAAVQGLYFQLKNAQLARNNSGAVTMSSQYIAGEKSLLAAGSEERKITPISDSMTKIVSQFSSSEEASVSTDQVEVAQ